MNAFNKSEIKTNNFIKKFVYEKKNDFFRRRFRCRSDVFLRTKRQIRFQFPARPEYRGTGGGQKKTKHFGRMQQGLFVVVEVVM
jgi:hypothetical protein